MKKLCLLLFLFVGHLALAQFANDCTSAVVVCGNSNIVSNASGFGTQELDNTSNPCFFEEINSIWLELNIAESGILSFEIRPESSDLVVDYDFYVFGPGNACGNFNDPIRCSTTNPLNAGLNYNTTGLRETEIDESEGPGADGNSFVSALAVQQGETYYLLIDRPHGSGGFDLNWTGTSSFFEPPEANEPTDISLCLATTGTPVDLSQKASEITTDPNSRLSYFTSYADAFDGNNPVADPTAFELGAANTTIYVKVRGDNACFEIRDFDIIVDNFLPFSIDPGLVSCDQDQDGLEDFDLNQITNTIVSTLSNPSNTTINYFVEEDDALNDINAINSNLHTSTTATIYTRISDNTDLSCWVVLPVPLNVISSPIPLNAELLQCDVDETDSTDGITAFNLEQLYQDIPGSADFEFFFYESLAAVSNDDPIENLIGYVNTVPFNQTIYFTAESRNFGCLSSGALELQVQPTTVSLNSQSPFVLCDENPGDDLLQASFDLEAIRTLNYPNLEATFYASLEDVTLELHPLTGIYSTETTIIYVRIENSNQCQGVEQIELRVNPAPDFKIQDEYLVCTDGNPMEILGPEGFDHYRWIRVEGNTERELSRNQDFVIGESGNFELEVGTAFNTNGGSLLCTRRKSFKILPSNRAVISNILIEDIADTNTVEVMVTGDGNYEYSLDGITYQDSPLFLDVLAGFLTVYVRDKNGCGISESEISVIGYPRFFTPNADGVNDLWQISGINEHFQSESTIYIYDRYGKLLAQLDAQHSGWNGTYNNNSLPSADYWFRAVLEDGREFSGHFALKR
ncbi:MAG: T9SS type B sorting domain-containing protein [Flavobacteriaceae bacterium]